MERLKALSVEKFTLDGRKFHTLTILSAKYLFRVLLTQLGLYNLYAWPLLAEIYMSTGSLPKCGGFITLSASVISPTETNL